MSFTLADESVAERFLAALQIVAVATSFGGLHSTAERRARWGGDDVPGGFIRFSCGGEDTADLVADVTQAERGVLPQGNASIEARFGAVFEGLLFGAGWVADEPWTPLRRDELGSAAGYHRSFVGGRA